MASAQAARCPLYDLDVKDINGRSVVQERLLLPFFNDGMVSHIIASLKSISDDGKFEINNLLRDPDKLPEYKLRAVIDREPCSPGQGANREGRAETRRRPTTSSKSDAASDRR